MNGTGVPSSFDTVNEIAPPQRPRMRHVYRLKFQGQSRPGFLTFLPTEDSEMERALFYEGQKHVVESDLKFKIINVSTPPSNSRPEYEILYSPLPCSILPPPRAISRLDFHEAGPPWCWVICIDRVSERRVFNSGIKYLGSLKVPAATTIHHSLSTRMRMAAPETHGNLHMP